MSSIDNFLDNIKTGKDYKKDTNFDIIKDDFLELFRDVAEDHGLNKEHMQNLGKKAAKILAWKYTAKDEEEKRQADIAYEILTKEIPITLKGMVSTETVARSVAKILVFGLKVAKLLIAL